VTNGGVPTAAADGECGRRNYRRCALSYRRSPAPFAAAVSTRRAA